MKTLSFTESDWCETGWMAFTDSLSCETGWEEFTDTVTCETGWEAFSDSCYFFAHEARVTYSGAQNECNNRNASLVTITNQHEQNFLTGM